LVPAWANACWGRLGDEPDAHLAGAGEADPHRPAEVGLTSPQA
jgi:hypothetical protein